MSTGAEVVGDSAERDQETLCVLRRLEPLENPFAFTRRQVRFFSAVVQALVPTMLTVRQCSANRGRVAGKFVGDHDARLGAALAVKHPTQKPLGSYLIASVLDKDVQCESVLVDGSPEPVAFAADLERYLVQMPVVAGSDSSSTQPCGEAGAELSYTIGGSTRG